MGMKEKGFTLIELLVVVAIIGILATVAISSYVGVMTKSARSEAYSNLESLRLLEEQFFAENARYTPNLGMAGKDNPGNVVVIQTGGGVPADALPGFRPGTGPGFSYWIVQDFQITNINATPPTTAATAPTPCFVAFAAGNTSTRVDGDVFAIDCNNNRNF
ncbi:MAG: prepilin-type N-terminal cleavage/methylation domain-containing protein [Nitrospirota bacterium]